MKVVVVTGSTRGIGKGLVESFVARGCRVVVTGRSQTAVDDVVSQLAAKRGAEVTGIACDITRVDDIQALWDHAVENFGRVDVWVNNAGMSIDRKPLWELAAADIETIVSTNLTGLLLANKVAMAGMKIQGQGQIWSMEGFGSNGMAQLGMATYGATKRAVNYLNKALRKDAAGTGIQMCTLSPGIVITDLLIGDYDTSSDEWQKTRRIFNILADKVETVTPWLVDGMLAANKEGAKVEWLTNKKAAWRFMTSSFNKRDLFEDLGV